MLNERTKRLVPSAAGGQPGWGGEGHPASRRSAQSRSSGLESSQGHREAALPAGVAKSLGTSGVGEGFILMTSQVGVCPFLELFRVMFGDKILTHTIAETF